MTKEMRAMLQELETKKAEVRALLGENKVTEAENLMAEVRGLQKKVELQQEVEAMEELELNAGTPVPSATQNLNAEYKRIFMRGLRRQHISADDYSIVNEYLKVNAVMHEGGASGQPDGDSNLIIPQDVSTKIHELMRTINDLSQYIRMETVNTLSGSRVLEKDEDMTPFAVVAEYGEIPDIDNPHFTPLTYTLVKRAGILPLTNELLKDSDQNILAYVTSWIAKKHIVTRNGLIATLWGTLTKKDLADLKAIKKVLNVELDPAISLSGSIITNQDGFNWLDTQVDANGRFLLQDDITQPGRKLFNGRAVIPVTNKVLPSVGTTTVKAPIILGNFKELAVLFTDGRYELASTKEGGSAFKRDTTDLRTIVRDDVRLWDSKAVVYGQLTI